MIFGLRVSANGSDAYYKKIGQFFVDENFFSHDYFYLFVVWNISHDITGGVVGGTRRGRANPHVFLRLLQQIRGNSIYSPLKFRQVSAVKILWVCK